MKKLILALPLTACLATTEDTRVYVDEFNGKTVRVVDVTLAISDKNDPSVIALAKETCGGEVSWIGQKVLETPQGVVAAHVGHLFKCL